MPRTRRSRRCAHETPNRVVLGAGRRAARLGGVAGGGEVDGFVSVSGTRDSVERGRAPLPPPLERVAQRAGVPCCCHPERSEGRCKGGGALLGAQGSFGR